MSLGFAHGTERGRERARNKRNREYTSY